MTGGVPADAKKETPIETAGGERLEWCSRRHPFSVKLLSEGVEDILARAIDGAHSSYMVYLSRALQVATL